MTGLDTSNARPQALVPEDHEDTSYFDERGLEGTSHAYDSSDPDHHQHLAH